MKKKYGPIISSSHIPAQTMIRGSFCTWVCSIHLGLLCDKSRILCRLMGNLNEMLLHHWKRLMHWHVSGTIHKTLSACRWHRYAVLEPGAFCTGWTEAGAEWILWKFCSHLLPAWSLGVCNNFCQNHRRNLFTSCWSAYFVYDPLHQHSKHVHQPYLFIQRWFVIHYSIWKKNKIKVGKISMVRDLWITLYIWVGER